MGPFLSFVIFAVAMMALPLSPSHARPIEACEPMLAQLGLPKPLKDKETGVLLTRDYYQLSYNAKTLTADWVIECLDYDDLTGIASRENNYRIDKELAARSMPYVRPSDYTHSGYDRGHQAPAADFKHSVKAMRESFYMSNIAPQVGVGFNRHIWARLERTIRHWAKRRRALLVITGPVNKAPHLRLTDKTKLCRQDTQTTTINKDKLCIHIPAAFFKVILEPRGKRALAFLLPNGNLSGRAIREFQSSIDTIEKYTGLDFFPRLTARQQRIIESKQSPIWYY